MNDNQAPSVTNLPARAGRSPVRKLLILLLAFFGLFSSAVVAIGQWPEKPDIPPAGLTNGAPGSGGLRRQFPDPKLRPDNPTTEERVALGRLLFFDPVLSGDNSQSCATCHHPDMGFSDGRHFSMGKGGQGLGPERKGGEVIKRGAPTIWNSAYNFRQFWDGRAADLEEQAKFPITSEVEMNQNPEELVKELKAIPAYVNLFDEAFDGSNGSAVTVDNAVKALAAFERTLLSYNSPFDRYAAGDNHALTPQQKHGLTLFRSLKTRCFECHGFPTFANPDFKVIGVPPMLGQYAQPDDLGRAEIEGGEPYKHAFKVPTLRNIELTAPYMHDGSIATLEEVIKHYKAGGRTIKDGKNAGNGSENPFKSSFVRGFYLTPQETQDLIEFLKSLTDDAFVNNPKFRQN